MKKSLKANDRSAILNISLFSETEVYSIVNFSKSEKEGIFRVLFTIAYNLVLVAGCLSLFI